MRVYGRALSEEDRARLADGQEIPSSGAILAIAAEQRTPSQRERLRRHYLEHVDTEYQRLKAELADLTKRQGELDKSIPAVMIMLDLEQPRPTHVLRRGQYDQPGDQVSAAIPGLFPKLPAEGPANRLALARAGRPHASADG